MSLLMGCCFAQWSCRGLLRDPGKEAWEVSTDVPSSLESGRASRGPQRVLRPLAGMNSNLARSGESAAGPRAAQTPVGFVPPADADFSSADLLLPDDPEETLVDIPKPGEMRRPAKRERIEMLRTARNGEVDNLLMLPPPNISSSRPVQPVREEIPRFSPTVRRSEPEPSALLWPERT